MDKTKTFRAEQVAARVGISTKTLNAWYAYKLVNPGNALFATLPEFVREAGNVRVWTKEDIIKLRKFKSQLPRGRKGIMGKYAGKGTGRENGKTEVK